MILKRKDYPDWLKEADIENETVSMDEYGCIVWHDGIWLDGTWEYGIWHGGTWKNGTWECGIWHRGTWKNGTWLDGIWHRGTWKNGTWECGIWNDGYVLFAGRFKYQIFYNKNHIKVGCKTKTIKEWCYIIKHDENYYKQHCNKIEYNDFKKALKAIKYINEIN